MRPAPALLVLLAALLLAALALGSARALDAAPAAFAAPAWWSALALLALLAGGDALALRRRPSPRLQRRLPASLAQDRWSEASLRVEPMARPPHWLQLFDGVPTELEFRQLPQRLRLAPDQAGELRYGLRPRERGAAQFVCCEVLLPSPLGLWQARRQLPLPDRRRVLPDLSRLQRGALHAAAPGLGGVGVAVQPRRGSGREFHQLREFRDGDSLRQIDWKATARKRQPVAREYREERDQQIVLLLDGGRRMRSRDGPRSHFDHSLEACLQLADAALAQGDALGVQVFGAARDCRLAPGKGPRQWAALLDALHDLQPGRLPGDYLGAAAELLAGQQRRALVVLVSNLCEEDEAQLPQAAAQIAARHRLLIVSLREAVVERSLRQTVNGYNEALGYCGADEHAASRAALHARLGAQGLPVLDVAPAALGPALLDRYLQWKASGRG